jgi:aspartate/methionine/tyrosine aminotransferase
MNDAHTDTTPFAPIAYMRWAKMVGARAQHSLAQSGMHTPALEDVPYLRVGPALALQGADGDPAVRAAIAAREGVAEDQVLVAPGTSGANFLLAAAVLHPGDEALVETPGYEPLWRIPRALGARVRRIPRSAEDGFALDPDRLARLIRPNTRLVILTDLHNPSGARLAEDVREAVLALADLHGFFVLLDEVYAEFLWEARPAPLGVRSQWGLTTSSLTKAYGLGGLRAGWGIGPVEVVARARHAADYVNPEESSVAAAVIVAAFQHLDLLVERSRAHLERAWALWSKWAAEHPSMQWTRPAGGACFAARAPRGKGDAFAGHLLARHGLAVAPGRFFDAPEFVRLGLGGPLDQLEAALERLSEGLAEFDAEDGASDPPADVGAVRSYRS